MIYKVEKSVKIASLQDCADTLMHMCKGKNELDSDAALKKLEKISKITRQFEKVFLAGTVAGSYVSLSLFIGSVSLLCSSGIYFLVPLALSVGSTLITVDLVSAKVLTERIRKVARQAQDFYRQDPLADNAYVSTEKGLREIKKICGRFSDLLVLPDISGTKLCSFKQLMSHFLLKQAGKLVIAQDILEEELLIEKQSASGG